jgi:hypothetical protein
MENGGLAWLHHMEIAQHILQSALQLAASGAAATPLPAAVGTHGTPQQQQQQRLGLCLTGFASSWLVGPAVLAALPAHSLTCLNLDLHWATSPLARCTISVNGLAIAEHLSRFGNLQELNLGVLVCELQADVAAACLASIAHLTQLTSLRMYGQWEDVEQPLQQLLSQLLRLKRLDLNFGKIGDQLQKAASS